MKNALRVAGNIVLILLTGCLIGYLLFIAPERLIIDLLVCFMLFQITAVHALWKRISDLIFAIAADSVKK